VHCELPIGEDPLSLGVVCDGLADVMVLSLVADGLGSPRRPDRVDQQPELWNVAIIRAKAKIVVIDDREVRFSRGRISGELLTAATGEGESAGRSTDPDLSTRRCATLTAIPATTIEIGVTINGHWADAVVSGGGRTFPILLDAGPADSVDPADHLRRMLRRRALLGEEAVRLPA
jgi:hypothetical protein